MTVVRTLVSPYVTVTAESASRASFPVSNFRALGPTGTLTATDSPGFRCCSPGTLDDERGELPVPSKQLSSPTEAWQVAPARHGDEGHKRVVTFCNLFQQCLILADPPRAFGYSLPSVNPPAT
mmetsp:Transcript_3625/g.13012  ORF Transcript_3625/g.13012 Transcript_3625/m.13012 type:complete len:123 (-) Transcript_3625:138-506(-)|eukprot:scaffold4372_cov397-Prasinococcus_capsulatus_cf.AAC.47